MTPFDDICTQLPQLSSVLVSSHISPDPDAIGSSCALALGLQSLGKEIQLYYADAVPEKLRTLVAEIPITHTIPERSYSAVIVVDTAAKKRVGNEADKLLALGEVSINIDHHVSNDGWASLNYIDPLAAASAQIVLHILLRLGVSLNKRIADLLYAGIIDDTGRFCFSNTTSGVLEDAATLLRHGASALDVGNALYFSVPLRVFQLRTLVFSKLALELEGKIAFIVITQQMLDQCKAVADDTEGLVEEARSVPGTIGSVLMREIKEGWKLSLRSKVLEFNVDAVASKFGGGGHKAAAGCKVVGSQEEVKERVLEEIRLGMGSDVNP